MSSARRDSHFNESAFRRVIARQHGLVTTAQAREVGLTKDGLARRVQRGELVRAMPRVYRSVVVPRSPAQAALAAVLWAGKDAVASHTTAARVWGLGDQRGGALHVWVPPGRGPSSKLVVVHRGVVAPRDRRVRDGVPVTAPARAVIDLAGLLEEEELEASMEDALHRGLTTPLSLRRCLDAVGGTGRKGTNVLRRLLDDRDDRALESRLEVKVWRLLRRAGLRPVRQHDVRCGGRRYRLDFAFPAQKVAIEAEGFAAHGGRAAFVRDRQRRADLAAEGWIVIPLTWEDCTSDSSGVITRIRTALVRAA